MADRNITVRVLPPNARAIEVSVPEGSTVRQVLEQGHVSLAKAQVVRIAGETVGMETPVQDQQILSIASDVVGG